MSFKVLFLVFLISSRMKVHPYPKKKQSTNFQKSQREFNHELKRLREIKKFGPLLDRAACQNALTKFQDRVVYVKSNGLNQLDLWDLETHSLLYCFEAAHQGSIYAMTVTSKQNLLLSGSADKSIAVWDLEQKKLAHRFNDAHIDIVTFIVTSSSEKKLLAASTSLDRSIAFWDLINMKSEGKLNQHIPRTSTRLRLSPTESFSSPRVMKLSQCGRSLRRRYTIDFWMRIPARSTVLQSHQTTNISPLEQQMEQ